MNHKLAFCFLTINDINNPNIWNNFFIDNSRYNIYIHSKNPSNVKSFFKNYIIKSVPTSWGFIIYAY
jgi:hypothetical protein